MGRGQAAPLTTVRVAATQSTTLQVEDALWFSPGLGVTTGDVLRIGTNVTARVTAREVEARTLTLDHAVTVPSGAPVTLDGEPNDVGVWTP